MHNTVYNDIQQDRIDTFLRTPTGNVVKMLNADTTATGIPSRHIEQSMQQLVPLYANTHSNAFAGNNMSKMIRDVRNTVAREFHVDRAKYDILFTGTGCTMAVKHILHILGVYEHPNDFVILITENEHHAVHLGCIQALNKLNKGTVNNLIVVPTIAGTNQINATALLSTLQSLAKSKKQVICFFNHGSNVTGSLQDQKNINYICKTVIPSVIMCWDYAC